MDRLTLQILDRELAEDAAVMSQAAGLASQRFHETHPGHLEACGYELNRLYNVLEKAFERIADAFENHFDKRGDYHERLIQRLALDIPGVRPAFFRVQERAAIRELKSFRHIFRHAYDLQLRADRLRELVEIGERVTAQFPTWCDEFVQSVQRELTKPPRSDQDQ